MSRKILGKIPLILGLGCLVLAAIMLSWHLVPAKSMEKELTIPAGVLPASPGEHPITIQQALEIRVSYPSQIRAGEKDMLRLQVRPGEATGSGTAVENQLLTLTAELTMIAMLQSPQGAISSGFDPQQPREFSWELTSQDAGMRQGSLWVSLHPIQDDGAEIEVPLVAWEIEIEVVRLWGMNSTTVTLLAMLLLLAWGGMMVLGVKLEHDLKLNG